MSSKIVLPVIAGDTTSNRTAAFCRSQKPGRWAADEDVPFFLYKSLKEILLGPNATDVDYLKLLVTTYGEGTSPEDEGIHILTLPFESHLRPEGMQSNIDGAETAILKILSQVGPDISDDPQNPNGNPANIAEQADLRIRFLIDYNWRRKRNETGDTKVTPGLPGDGDPTVYPNSAKTPIVCIWNGFIDNQSVIAKASIYTLQYFRIIF